jgi:hypothetical protein
MFDNVGKEHAFVVTDMKGLGGRAARLRDKPAGMIGALPDVATYSSGSGRWRVVE